MKGDRQEEEINFVFRSGQVVVVVYTLAAARDTIAYRSLELSPFSQLLCVAREVSIYGNILLANAKAKWN
jgi:hypothetical protein